MKQVVLLTGAAGSGLSSAEYVFEELGYFVSKNIPTSSLNHVLDSFLEDKNLTKMVVISHAVYAKESIEILLNRNDLDYKIIVLTCDTQELNKRYTLTRKVHPRCVTEKCSAEEAIKKDEDSVSQILEYSSFVLDTTSISIKQLRSYLYQYLANYKEDKSLSVTFMSFGLKNGIPQGIDMFIDVRTLPNPYWVDELKELTGGDKRVIDYINSFKETEININNIINYIDKHLLEVKKQRNAYVIGVACSGGKHRSTYVANLLKEHFKDKYLTSVIHRDTRELNKDE